MEKRNDGELSTYKRAGIVAGVILVLLGIVWLYSSFTGRNESSLASQTSYALDVPSGEQLVLAQVRQAIAQSALDGTGKLQESQCEKLGSIAKKLNPDALWFSSCSFTLYGSTPDTDSTDVTKLSDGNYCATFTTTGNLSLLTKYEFTEGTCGSARVEVTQ